ncbi:Rap1a/Tai family immunity protein [endosymbiont of Lamellibrachia barhami]|uniref:Rap1a/Tai family immunity protein n=1 Tax=endosymbiont of Lamellibrachia barhami TaxID=205975 RepID=UPI0015AF6512|nr:Rap1a/Tai family immunity protein [endosymbiont of Lamellibrachia barhami]
MKKTYRSLTALPLILMLSGNAYALSGQDYLDKCKKAITTPLEKETAQQAVNRALDAGSCGGFLGGTLGGMNLVGNMLLHKKALKRNFVCLDEGKQINELMKEFLVYLEGKPKDMKAPVQMHIFNHFSKKYYCKPIEKQ